MSLDATFRLRRRDGWHPSRWFMADEFYESLQPLIRLSYWHGLTPFYIARDDQGRECLKSTVFGYLNSICHVVIYTICYILMLLNEYESVAGYFFRSDISRFADFMQVLSGFIGVTVIYITALVSKHRLQKGLQALQQIDILLQALGLQVNYSHTLQFSYVALTIIFSINILYIMVTFTLLRWFQEERPSIALHITFVLQHTVISLVIRIFVCINGLLRLRFIMLNKELFSPSDAYSADKALLWVTFLLGLTPFRMCGPPGQRTLRLSRLGFVNTILQVCFFMFCFIYSLIFQESIVGYFFQSEISKIGDTLQKFIGMIGLLILFSFSVGKYRDVIFLCQSIHRLDQRFLNIGVVFKYRYIMKFTHSRLFLVIGLNCAYMISSLCLLFRNDIWPSYQAIVSFFLPHVSLLMIVVLFSALAMRLEQHFDLVNKVLKNLLHQWTNRSLKAIPHRQRSMQCLDSYSIYTIVTKNTSEIIQESMEIHQLICEAASTANKYFTYQLLTIVSIAFLIIVFDAYYVLETLLGKSQRESKFRTIEFVTFFSCQMILYLIAIVAIVEGSNRATSKSEKTGIIVHTLLNRTTNPEVKERLHQFSLQLLHMKFNFTAAGLFNIDRTLYFTISGALTTYLIILLQFTSSTPNRDNGNSGSCSGSNCNLTIKSDS